MQRLKVGIIGVGMAFEKLHYPQYAKMPERYEISAICDADAEKTRAWAGTLELATEDTFTAWEEMLRARPDLDVVDIMVPIRLNYEVMEGVAKAIGGQRKGIICEKPLAATLREAVEARDLPERYSIPIMIAENLRYNDEVNIIRNLLLQGKVGDVLHFIQHRVVDFPGDMVGDKFPGTEWRQRRDFRGGAIADMGVHDIAALHHIFGPIESLHAFGRPLDASLDWSPFSVIQANILFASGVTGSFTFFCAGREMQRPLVGLRIFGTRGMVFLEDRDCGTVNVSYNSGGSEQIGYEVQSGYYKELLNFHNALTQGEPILVTPQVEFDDVLIVHMILKSVEQGRAISSGEFRDLALEGTGQEPGGPAAGAWQHFSRMAAGYGLPEGTN